MNRRNLLKWFSFAPFAGLASAVKAVENPTEIVKLVFETKTCYYAKINGIHVLHRLDGPAVEDVNGNKYWYIDGKRHCLDGPAVEYINGNKEWWIDNQLHRLDGPAIERADGNKEWWVGNQLHRLDGPAIERTDGYKSWWVNGKLHREDGPAVEYADGNKQWWVDGRKWKEFIKENGVTNVSFGASIAALT